MIAGGGANATGWSGSAPCTSTASRACCTARGWASCNRGPGASSSNLRARSGDGHALAPHLVSEIKREHARLMLVQEQIAAIEAQAEAVRQAAAPDTPAAKINQLIDLKSVGPVSSQMLVGEVFFRDFKNRRQVGSYFGLTGTPFNSGDSQREQGISKAGNPRARSTAVELAWLWRRHQPDSALSRWFEARVGHQKGRVKRIAIVAMARKLMVALWRFLEHGVVPEGAILQAAPRT